MKKNKTLNVIGAILGIAGIFGFIVCVITAFEVKVFNLDLVGVVLAVMFLSAILMRTAETGKLLVDENLVDMGLLVINIGGLFNYMSEAFCRALGIVGFIVAMYGIVRMCIHCKTETKTSDKEDKKEN